ncbi:MAG: hypothetical protein IPN94_16630 [Sphingobacteriales bacterium]|nr:hypothetical protein [Sphingobacteriales bacterium]
MLLQGALGYLWNDLSTNATLTPSTASAGTTTYTVTVTAPTGCTDVTATATVIIYDPIVAPTYRCHLFVGSTATALNATCRCNGLFVER